MGELAVSDEELVNRKQAGDTTALDILVGRYYKKTLRRVRYLVRSDDVKDVAQDIFLHLTRSVDSFREESAFSTWFNKVVMNRVADYYRKLFLNRNRFPFLEDFEEIFGDTEPCEYPAPLDWELLELLGELPEKYSIVIIMKDIYDMSFYEIAEALGITYEAARSRHRRAVKLAARMIDPDLLRLI